MAKSELNFPNGSWAALLEKAYSLFDTVAADGFTIPQWSLGGGTVLMFNYAHRKSKDVDIFLPDPQFLGYINPRIGGRGEDITSEYKDGTEYVKLLLPEGEIDFIASSTLTNNPFEIHEVLGRNVLLETPVEIVAKKLWHRGDRATPRDLLDLAVVIDHQYNDILNYRDVFVKNIEIFTNQCESRKAFMLPVFDAIEKIEFNLSFDECLERVNALKADLLRDLTNVKNVIDGNYYGKIVDVVGGIAVQKNGRDPTSIVNHELSKLSNNVKKDDVVDIKYKNGVGEVSLKGKGVQK